MGRLSNIHSQPVDGNDDPNEGETASDRPRPNPICIPAAERRSTCRRDALQTFDRKPPAKLPSSLFRETRGQPCIGASCMKHSRRLYAHVLGAAFLKALSLPLCAKSGHSATAWRCIKSSWSSSSSKGFGFRIRKPAAILAADVVGFNPPTGADGDRTLPSQRRYSGAGPLAMTPRLVRTTQSPPRFSIRITRPAPGIESPGATSWGP